MIVYPETEYGSPDLEEWIVGKLGQIRFQINESAVAQAELCIGVSAGGFQVAILIARHQDLMKQALLFSPMCYPEGGQDLHVILSDIQKIDFGRLPKMSWIAGAYESWNDQTRTRSACLKVHAIGEKCDSRQKHLWDAKIWETGHIGTISKKGWRGVGLALLDISSAKSVKDIPVWVDEELAARVKKILEERSVGNPDFAYALKAQIEELDQRYEGQVRTGAHVKAITDKKPPKGDKVKQQGGEIA